ncbi:hypothetical protein ACFQ08_35090, partial [Streptosporangium algeriense]
MFDEREEVEEVIEDLARQPGKADELVRRLGAEAGVELPPLLVTGTDTVLPSVFGVDTAATASVGAAT